MTPLLWPGGVEFICEPERVWYGTTVPERWPSGLRRTLGKRVYVQAYRGFESHSLRRVACPSSHDMALND